MKEWISEFVNQIERVDKFYHDSFLKYADQFDEMKMQFLQKIQIQIAKAEGAFNRASQSAAKRGS